ncbi:hypothetical protein FJZ39_02230 [Candidatus Saccharibacteria bacterium]|nr:hypothetical protein [Candidatus Saccharibacteria bacterium]
MNNYDKLFTSLNERRPSEYESLLISVLQEFSTQLVKNPEKDTEIAYNIAGLMATDYARTLPQGSLLDEIFTIAGELEIDPEDRDALREELIQKIDLL